MPISEDEWEAGRAEGGGALATDPVGEYETEKDLVVAFLGENVNNAYTRAEIVKGVDFEPTEDAEAVGTALGELADEFLDAVGEVTASAIVVDDIDEALDELIEEGIVEAKEIEEDGGTVTYYRISK